MTAINETSRLWARTDLANGALLHPDDPEGPICCWNICASIHPAKAPRVTKGGRFNGLSADSLDAAGRGGAQ